MTNTRHTFELAVAGGTVPHQFIAFVPDGNGGRAAEHTFEWRTDSTALALGLVALEQAATAGRAPENDLHVTFGRRLYDTVLAGAVGELWRARLKEARRKPLRLVIRIDPASARQLLNLPWEYLHDGRDFLALSWRTPIARLPWGLEADTLGPLDEALRLLVLIAAPHGLSQNEVLNTAREEDLILEALAQAQAMQAQINGLELQLTTLRNQRDERIAASGMRSSACARPSRGCMGTIPRSTNWWAAHA
jgi:hypothetical protein